MINSRLAAAAGRPSQSPKTLSTKKQASKSDRLSSCAREFFQSS
jgi:hypothetical protein